MDYQQWMSKARSTIERLEPGTVFEVKSLFPPYEWDALEPGGKRLLAGIFQTSSNETMSAESKSSNEEKTTIPVTKKSSATSTETRKHRALLAAKALKAKGNP